MRANSEKIRHSILQSIFENYGVLEVKKVAYEYGVTAQTVYKHINYLEAHKKIQKIKSGRHNSYILLPELTLENTYPLENLSEDECLKRDFHPILKLLPQIANSVFSYVFLEMLNNAIEHSEGKRVYVRYEKRLCGVVRDFGQWHRDIHKGSKHIGIIRKAIRDIRAGKGKLHLTRTAIRRGIFFSSKAADEFVILSDHLMFVGKTSKKHVLKTD